MYFEEEKCTNVRFGKTRCRAQDLRLNIKGQMSQSGVITNSVVLGGITPLCNVHGWILN